MKSWLDLGAGSALKASDQGEKQTLLLAARFPTKATQPSGCSWADVACSHEPTSQDGELVLLRHGHAPSSSQTYMDHGSICESCPYMCHALGQWRQAMQ